ncbi:MAG: hypothetical protein AABZ45_05200 [Pseudomonadota bacterium]
MNQSTQAGVAGPVRSSFSSLSTKSLGPWLVAAIVVAALIAGWVLRGDDSINPELGIGYWLGIIGGSMMVLLLVYPIRKRVSPRTNWGSIGFWFRLHMLLGLGGPVLILYHSRFTWGALNSAVSMTAMLIVASSGLVGRFFYARVHRGYSGRKLEVRAILKDMHEELDSLSEGGVTGAWLRDQLHPFEQRTVAAGASFWASARSVIDIGIATRREQRRLRRDIAAMFGASDVPRNEWAPTKHDLLARSSAYFLAVRRAAEFAFYDRMLRLWHLFHLPLFFILVLTAILHIVAVHMY